MDYNTNILVVDATRVLYHKRLYEIVIPNHIKYNSGAGKTELQINRVKESGFFHPVMIAEWSKDDNHWSWQEMFRRTGILPSLLFGLCPLSKLLNRDGSIHLDLNELEKIKNNIRDYFIGMEEREEQYKKIKELVWWKE